MNDTLGTLMTKYNLTLTNFYATVEITNSEYKVIAAIPKPYNSITVGELREWLVEELNKKGYVL